MDEGIERPVLKRDGVGERAGRLDDGLLLVDDLIDHGDLGNGQIGPSVGAI